MRTVEEHFARIRAAAVAPEPVRVPIIEARGFVCAEEVVARRPLPGFDQASVDGYAVRSIDVAEAGPDYKGQFGQPADFSMPVVGESRTGSRQIPRLQPKQAVRIESGAPLPALADAVVPVEDTDSDKVKVKIFRPIRQGANIRSAGDDVRVGDVAVAKGTTIGSAHVGLLAAVGKTDILVYPRPRVAVLAVGTELVDIHASPDAGQVYDVNTYALASAIDEAGGQASRVGIVEPRADTIRSTVADNLGNCDILIVTGGVGGRSSDVVQEALLNFGNIEISRVAMHPGGMQGFGRLGTRNVPTFLLPELTSSALVVFEVMVRPLIRELRGFERFARHRVSAITVNDFLSDPDSTGFVRGKLMRTSRGEYRVRALGAVGTENRLVHSAEANCLIVVEPDVTHIGAGETVSVEFLAQRG